MRTPAEPVIQSELGDSCTRAVDSEREAERDARFAARLLALDTFAAAELLLTCGTPMDGEYEDIYEGAEFARAQPGVAAVTLPTSSSFASIDRYSMKDNAPAVGCVRLKTMSVHKCVVRGPSAAILNVILRGEAMLQRETCQSRSVSNAGGFHGSVHRLGLDQGLAGAWQARLCALLSEALQATHADGHVAGCPIEQLHFTGWLNVSDHASFNRPHDHGHISYSAVYHVDDGGEPPAQPLPPGWACGLDAESSRPYYYNVTDQLSQWHPPLSNEPLLPRCAGELLLQTQLAAWANQYAIFPITPVPGTLWLFPGYVPHAVLPRSTEAPAPRGPQVAAGDASMRVSVACNISTVASVDVPDLPTVWQASRMQ